MRNIDIPWKILDIYEFMTKKQTVLTLTDEWAD